MTINTFNTGRDCSLVFYDNTLSQTVAINITTGFDYKNNVDHIDIVPLNGPMLMGNANPHWSGSISFDRTDAVIDSFFAQLEDAYYSGQIMKTAYIIETIKEKSGSISQYRFEGCAFELSEGGKWDQKSSVKRTISWRAARRIKVS